MMIVTNSDILGKNIRYLREQNHMSCTELAEKTGWNVEELMQIEFGRLFDIDSEIFKKICCCFNADMNEILIRLLAEKKTRCE